MYRHLFYGDREGNCRVCAERVWSLPRNRGEPLPTQDICRNRQGAGALFYDHPARPGAGFGSFVELLRSPTAVLAAHLRTWLPDDLAPATSLRPAPRARAARAARAAREALTLIATLSSPRSTRFIRRLRTERRIPITKLGGHVRIDSNDLDAFIAAGRQDAGPQPT